MKEVVLHKIFICFIISQAVFLTFGMGQLEAFVGWIYWTDNYTDKIQRANLDGSNIEDLVTGIHAPRGIALDIESGKMYWMDIFYTDVVGPSKIQRANLDGSNVEDILILGDVWAYGLDLDLINKKMYWTEQGPDRIRRANMDGTNLETVVSTGAFITDLALDPIGAKVYWLGNGKIQRANLNGSNVEHLVQIGTAGLAGIDLDLKGGKMYWSNNGGLPRSIWRADMDGSNAEPIVSDNLQHPAGINVEITGRKIYWIDARMGGEGKIQRANLDGSDIEAVSYTHLTLPTN